MGLSERPLALICQVNTNMLYHLSIPAQQQLTRPSIRREGGDFTWGRVTEWLGKRRHRRGVSGKPILIKKVDISGAWRQQ